MSSLPGTFRAVQKSINNPRGGFVTSLRYVCDVLLPVLQFAYKVVSDLAVVTVEVERVVVTV